jgi:ABC-type bacteriocin/lantibiotic exporter with double-glycine peptidase domain
MTLLSVLHLQQRSQADCLPVCAQMVLTHLGHAHSYEQLVDLLGTRWFGTPFRRLKRLEQFGLSVTLSELSLVDIESHLKNDTPVIAYVHTADLSYWAKTVDHVVVVVGADNEKVYLNDPSYGQAPQVISRTEFELAQLRYDNLCAVITA